ncbi:hypothetical protein [Mycoplasma nasistruthionis]|uniref:hypothetical protein n=1 Tax=Mycoplasma nasistruthionis TaxID=353852 RepID=UPI0030B843D9
MSKMSQILRKSYIYIILGLVYIPLFFGAIFTFNSPTPKGQFNVTWTEGTTANWSGLLDEGRFTALLNTILLAIIVSFLVATISLITVYSLYRQKSKLIRTAVSWTSNIPLINPDNITAIGLVLVFGAFFWSNSSSRRRIYSCCGGSYHYGFTIWYFNDATKKWKVQ